MIILLGDTHGDFKIFDYIREKIGDDPDAIIIQVGDFGYWPMSMGNWKTTPWPVYFIDGNHEHFPSLWEQVPTENGFQIKQPVELQKNLFYIPRGTIHTFEGIKFGFMGGGESIDKYWRQYGVSVFHEERVQRHQVEELVKDAQTNPIDILITHIPPATVRDRAFPPLNHAEWNLDLSWVDVSMNNIEYLWNALDRPKLFCGHMHTSINIFNCRILDCNELYTL
jgi:predicted phosphodiesterase